MSDNAALFKEWLQKIANPAALPPAEQVHLLRQIIHYADQQYYVHDNPILSDVAYDQFFKDLQTLETQHPTLVDSSSPTQRIAKGLNPAFVPVQHHVPMLSLENSYNADDLITWANKLQASLPNHKLSFTVEPKYDGAGISLVYENDALHVAATRGDGIKGETITMNAKQIRSIPIHAALKEHEVQTIEIRGEVVIKKDTFQAFNEQRIAAGLPILANPRNAASGSLRMMDPEEVRKRGLYAILYHVSYHQPQPIADMKHPLNTGHYETLKWLQELGFPTPAQDLHLCNTIDEVIQICHSYENKRDGLPYELDGMVVKVNAYDLQESLGMTSHHPRWAIAYKFKARQASSVLEKVEFQVGRTGTITPVAKITPVHIGGVTISSVSLFNEDIIKEKDLHIGDHVLVERAGDVIPYIVKPIEELRTGTEQAINFPTHCPMCAHTLHQAPDEAAWRCININCPAQVVERLIHFVSKGAMDIKHLGSSNIKRFYELGFIKNITDIYRLPFDDISKLDKFGEKSIDNLKNAIETSKSQPLHRLIFALGIRYVGETTAKTLARAITDVKDLSQWSIEQLCTLEDVGPKVAQAVFEYFQDEENILLLDTLNSLGVQTTQQQETQEAGDQSLAGKTFLFTGTLTQFKRSEAEALVEAKGGKILSGVSSKLNYLIVGADAGSKLEKAKKLGSVNILSESDFSVLIEKS